MDSRAKERSFIERISNPQNVGDLILAINVSFTSAHKDTMNMLAAGDAVEYIFLKLNEKYLRQTLEEAQHEKEKILEAVRLAEENFQAQLLTNEQQQLAKQQAKPYIPLEELFSRKDANELKKALALHLSAIQQHQTNITALTTQLQALQTTMQQHAAQAAVVRQQQITQMLANLHQAGSGPNPVHVKIRNPKTGQYVAQAADSVEVQRIIEAAVPSTADRLMKIIYPETLREPNPAAMQMIDSSTLSLMPDEPRTGTDAQNVPPPPPPVMDILDMSADAAVTKGNLLTLLNMAFKSGGFDEASNEEITPSRIREALNANQPAFLIMMPSKSPEMVESFANIINDIKQERDIKVTMYGEQSALKRHSEIAEILENPNRLRPSPLKK